MARVTVTLEDASEHRSKPVAHVLTEANGHFSITDLRPGNYRLVLSTVGYRLLEKTVSVTQPDASIDFDLAMSPENSEHRDSVEVRADVFELAPDSGPTAFTLTGTEAKNLSSVLADDPMRALQSVPGVTANDDFDSRFSLHGAPYDQIGLYLDGILLHQPFHTVQGLGPSGSTAVFNGDMVASMTVESEGYGPQYADRTAGVIDIRTREGSADRIHFRASASIPDAGFLAEGPLGKGAKGSWMVSVHKSYLQYFLKGLAQDEPSLAFGFMDMQGQFTYRLTPANAFSFIVIDGISDLEGDSAPASGSYLALNTARQAAYHYTLTSLGWEFTPSHSFLLNMRAAFTRERFDDLNYSRQTLGQGYWGGWVAKTDATWEWGESSQLRFGAETRPTHAAGTANYYNDLTDVIPTNWYRGSALYSGGYAQQSFSGLGKRVSVSMGGRWDTLSANHQSDLSPQASVAYAPWDRGRVSFAWGRYAQFPDLTSLYSEVGSPRLLPGRSEHFTASFEQRLSDHSRVRVDVFERRDKDLLFQPYLEARLIDGATVGDSFQSKIQNSLSGLTNGADFFLQRRTANGWTGWVSYTFSRSEMRDALTGLHFPADQDQRHTANAYVSHRLRPSVNLSAKYSYGSGFPVPGFFSEQGDRFYLAPERNRSRLPDYQRLDLRMNKSRTFEHAKMTFFVECVNVLNHANYRFDSYNGFDQVSRQAYISLSKMFPVLPSAGVTFGF